jgi:hypothetical protein
MDGWIDADGVRCFPAGRRADGRRALMEVDAHKRRMTITLRGCRTRGCIQLAIHVAIDAIFRAHM